MAQEEDPAWVETQGCRSGKVWVETRSLWEHLLINVCNPAAAYNWLLTPWSSQVRSLII